MEAWRSLIGRAVTRLRAIGLGNRDWTWGGGTVLMLRHRHRQSRDVDIFVNDVQSLSYLSPRLNDRETDHLMDYHEQANTCASSIPKARWISSRSLRSFPA